MRLNKATSHAIRILVDCARARGELVKVAELSDRLGITMQNVFKIVHFLSRSGLLAAVRGRYGGVRLARAPDQIRVGDIVRAMETTELELDTGNRRDHELSSDVNKVLDAALEAFIGILDRHTLADLASLKEGVTREAARRPERRPAPARRRVPGTRGAATGVLKPHV